MVIGLLYVSDIIPATSWSTVNDDTFHKVFGVYGVGTLASLVAVYAAQTLDIIIFAKLKAFTKGKHLWLRNNVSTISAQFVDTFCVLSIMCGFGVIPWSKFYVIGVSSMTFKIIAALLDTPFFYLACYWVGGYKRESRAK